MSSKEATAGITEMVNGALRTLYESDLSPAEVMDLPCFLIYSSIFFAFLSPIIFGTFKAG
jgi:hypothetical protein